MISYLAFYFTMGVVMLVAGIVEADNKGRKLDLFECVISVTAWPILLGITIGCYLTTRPPYDPKEPEPTTEEPK